MFGIYRTVLAIFVVLGHLGTAPYIGAFSVFGFYILSGYLMTRIMQKTYGYSLSGILRYFTNRFLRIYPLYWISILISIALILLLSEDLTKSINSAIYSPENFYHTLQNIFIIFSIDSEPRLTPPAWALSVELFFYILIALGLSKNKTITLLWLSLSLFYTSYLIIEQANFSYRYFTLPAASLPFSIGSLIFHLESKKTTFKSQNNILLIMPLLLVNYFTSLFFEISATYGFYINLFLVTCLIYNLSRIKNHPLKILDNFLGNLSYPVYLLHYQCGIIAFLTFDFFDMNIHKGDLVFFSLSLFLTLFLSYFVSILIENKIELLRYKIRPLKRA
jgi:peptidoglycan/LPS O-acetylase OafA/YrhL